MTNICAFCNNTLLSKEEINFKIYGKPVCNSKDCIAKANVELQAATDAAMSPRDKVDVRSTIETMLKSKAAPKAKEQPASEVKYRGSEVIRSILKDFTVSELVDELRKRDGVAVIETPAAGEDEICVWADYQNRAVRTHPTPSNLRSLINDEVRRGHAIIMRITESITPDFKSGACPVRDMGNRLTKRHKWK